MNETKYYEVEIGTEPDSSENTWICIKGVRPPSVAEANAFVTKDCERYGGIVQGVFELPDKQYANDCYDLGNEDKWPVFGL